MRATRGSEMQLRMMRLHAQRTEVMDSFQRSCKDEASAVDVL